MGNYAEDYQTSSPQEKIDQLVLIYHKESTTKEEKILIRELVQKQYNILKGRD